MRSLEKVIESSSSEFMNLSLRNKKLKIKSKEKRTEKLDEKQLSFKSYEKKWKQNS